MVLIICIIFRQVIRAIKTLLALADLNEETTDSSSVNRIIGQRIQCLSCESHIVMDFHTMVRSEGHFRPCDLIIHLGFQMCHAHRHDSMEIKILPPSEPASLAPVRPLNKGMCAKLMRPMGQAKTFRGMRNYGCRHCLASASTPITEADATSDAACTPVVTNPPEVKLRFSKGKRALKSDPATRLFTFDGMVSHVKEK